MADGAEVVQAPWSAGRACPPSQGAAEPGTLGVERRRLARLLVVMPVVIAGLGWVGSMVSRPAALLHPDVALSETYLRHQREPVAYAPQSPEAP